MPLPTPEAPKPAAGLNVAQIHIQAGWEDCAPGYTREPTALERAEKVLRQHAHQQDNIRDAKHAANLRKAQPSVVCGQQAGNHSPQQANTQHAGSSSSSPRGMKNNRQAEVGATPIMARDKAATTHPEKQVTPKTEPQRNNSSTSAARAKYSLRSKSQASSPSATGSTSATKPPSQQQPTPHAAIKTKQDMPQSPPSASSSKAGNSPASSPTKLSPTQALMGASLPRSPRQPGGSRSSKYPSPLNPNQPPAAAQQHGGQQRMAQPYRGDVMLGGSRGVGSGVSSTEGFKVASGRSGIMVLSVAPKALTDETVWLPSPNLQKRLQATIICRALVQDLISAAMKKGADDAAVGVSSGGGSGGGHGGDAAAWAEGWDTSGQAKAGGCCSIS